MKRNIFSVLFVILMACLFTIGASAYENEDFIIDIPESYTIIEQNGQLIAQSPGGQVTITIQCGDAMGDTFYNLTDEQIASYDDLIKNAYSAYGTVSNFESDYGGNEQASALVFSLDITGTELGVSGVVEGMMYVEDDYLYHGVFVITDEAYYDEASAISATFMPKTKLMGFGSDSNSQTSTSQGVAVTEDPVVNEETVTSQIDVSDADNITIAATDEVLTENSTDEKSEIEAEAENGSEDDSEDDKNNKTDSIVVVAIVAVMLIAIVAIVLIKKKK